MEENRSSEQEYRPAIAMGEDGYPDPLSLAEGIYRVLDRRNADNPVLFHVGTKLNLTDYFMVCSGKSTTHVRALADEVEYRLGLCGIKPDNRDSRGEANSWIVIDYGNVMVHVFTKEAREFYNLDRLFSDTERITVEPDTEPEDAENK